MRKITSVFICAVLLISLLCTGAIEAAAYLGSGARVVAAEISMIKTALTGQKICFTDGDFKSALVLSDFESITITEIPSSTEGTLLLNGRRVGKGRVIKRRNLGALVFIPASDAVTSCSFKFTVDGYAGGAEIECVMKFIDKINYAPEATGDTSGASTIQTQASISFFGSLGGSDPENDSLEYIIISYPQKGSVTLTDPQSGEYRYTPASGYTGKDKFSYVVRDEYGNYSRPVSVSVKISDRMCSTVYRDMEDRKEYNAAVAMTAMGIMDGSLVGDDLYFNPDESVTRAEFVAMAMKCLGIRADSSLTSTYFDDDDEIPAALKGYVATAQRVGIIVGDFKNGRLLFSPNEGITKYEAAKILSIMLDAGGEGEESVFAADSSIPVWARAGVSAMCSLGIFDSHDSSTLSDKVSRGDIAEFLYRISKLK